MTPQERAVFQVVSEHLCSGHDVSQIARSTDLKPEFLEQLLLREDFQAFFKSEHPQQFAIWTELRAEEASGEIVKSLAKANAVRNFKALQKLVDDPTVDLKPGERAAILEKLLRMSGTTNDEAVVETVKISSAHLAALIAADRETR